MLHPAATIFYPLLEGFADITVAILRTSPERITRA
jgi:hypothetical protein